MVKAQSSVVVSREIRTYMTVSRPLDPARVVTLTDLDLSYALASPLVNWDDSHQIIAALASRWSIASDQSLHFTLSDQAKWSNGVPILAEDVKASLRRAEEAHGEDLKSLFSAVSGIDCPDSKTVVIRLKGKSAPGAILKKLTEPMYGVVKVKDRLSVDLSVSSGPFYLDHDSADELVMKSNPYWFDVKPGMAERLVIRAPLVGQDPQTALFSDPWPNLIASHSLMSLSLNESLKNDHLKIWPRSYDRFYLLTAYNGRMKSPEGFAFFRYLQSHLDSKDIPDGLTGYSPTNQMFPRGSILHSDMTQRAGEPVALPQGFRGKALHVLISPERVSPKLRDNFARALARVTGATPVFNEVPINQLAAVVKTGDFDFYLGSVGVTDPNYEGTLSYFFELNPTLIPSAGGQEDFAQRTVNLRLEKDDGKRLGLAREILQDVIRYGHIVPLFHCSTVVIARPEIDLSAVPTTDETISFSKVRFQ
jgi:MarR-like DNA-binding transcriptional regulator SgrR of sgrS sRNA